MHPIERLFANSSVYLCGQVENDLNAAAPWRRELAINLHHIEPLLRVWDPLVKPLWMGEARNDQVVLQWKSEVLGGDAEKAKKCFTLNRDIRRVCKQLASKCDWMIARITKTFTWGSIDELEIGINRRIPIFLWLPDGLISIYGLSGCVHNIEHLRYYVHKDMGSLIETLDNINSRNIDIVPMDPETWMFRSWINAAWRQND